MSTTSGFLFASAVRIPVDSVAGAVAAIPEKAFRTDEPDIRMTGSSGEKPDAPEIDAMDYRNEYSMMNDAEGSVKVRILTYVRHLLKLHTV